MPYMIRNHPAVTEAVEAARTSVTRLFKKSEKFCNISNKLYGMESRLIPELKSFCSLKISGGIVGSLNFRF